MNVFGEFYGRDGVDTVNFAISDDKIQELMEANADSEEKFDMLAMDFEGEDNMSVAEYCAREAIVGIIEDNKHLVLPLNVSEEEYTFGLAMTEDDARISLHKGDIMSTVDYTKANDDHCDHEEYKSEKFSDAVCLNGNYYDVHVTACTECGHIKDSETFVE